MQNSSGIHHQDQNHTRVINSLLGVYEKKLLLWLAARMPAWVVPDTLTAVGLVAAFIIFAGYALTYFDKNFLWLASFGFLLHWFGDSMDGTLARYRKIERPRYGFFVDHIIDALSEALVFISLGLSPYVRFDLALLGLVGYLMVSVYVYLVTYVNGVFRISYAGLGPTEMRLIAIAGNVLVYFVPNPTVTIPTFGILTAPLQLTYYDLLMVWIVLLAIYVFTVFSIKTAMELSAADRIASRERKQKERHARSARRQALRDERAARKLSAKQSSRQDAQILNTGGED